MELDIVSYLMGHGAAGGGGGGGGTAPHVYSGTETPSNSLGNDGDVYIKYAVQGNSGLVDSQLGWACPPLYYATKANTEYGSLYGRSYKKSYDAPGIACYAKIVRMPGFANAYVFPLTISLTKNGASKIDGETQQPTSESNWHSGSYGGLTWWYDLAYGIDNHSNITMSGGQIGLQSRIDVPSTITTLEGMFQYCMQTIGVVTGIATPGTYYIKDSGTWTLAP